MKISVAMAYYNGGMYIEEQMDTILTQLSEQDEVIVSVDGASDGSKLLLLKMAEEDKRIHVIKGPGKGVVKNFENAAKALRGEDVGDGFYGMVFQDSDAAKWIEAAAYSLALYPDEKLSETVDELIDKIAAAQEGSSS